MAEVIKNLYLTSPLELVIVVVVVIVIIVANRSRQIGSRAYILKVLSEVVFFFILKTTPKRATTSVV